MADYTVDIDFSNVQFTDGGAETATLTGSITVDYSTGAVTGGLTATITGPFSTVLNFSVTDPLITGGGFYTSGSNDGNGNSVVVQWMGLQPTSLFSAFLFNSSPSDTFDVNTVSGPGFINNDLAAAPVCFVKGTLIRTPEGDRRIETLSAGDAVTTSSGEVKRVKWVGRRTLDCRRYADPRTVQPIRICADALGPRRPSQDLLVSPAHAICIDLCGEVFVHAANLINHSTIAPVEVDEVEYWHVELDDHDVLIANNLPAESYLDTANRGFFAREGVASGTEENDPTPGAPVFCRPILSDLAVLRYLCQRLAERAQQLGWARSRDANVRLSADGKIVRPTMDGGVATFCFAAAARDVRLLSSTFVPSEAGEADPRRLGVSLSALSLSAGRNRAPLPVALDDPRLEDGLHHEERRAGAPWRWTKGELRLKPELWAALAPSPDGMITLRVSHDPTVLRQWSPPRPPKVAASNSVAMESLRELLGACPDSVRR